MNIKKIEKQLKKINQLFESIKEDEAMSAIERDLMLSYIRELYERIALPQNHASDDKATPSASSKMDRSTEPVKATASFQKVNNLADVVMKEVVEADQFLTQQSASFPLEENDTVSNQQTAVLTKVIEDPNSNVPQEILDLFEFETINELSDKLSRAPISDLTKSMGINEKIFTVQELFGGDSASFNNAMASLNKFTSLEQARDYLVKHIAVDQNWSDKDKMKKAANFIKHISRRY
jgi:hypothetical protein